LDCPPRPDRRSRELDDVSRGPLPQWAISSVSNQLRPPLTRDQLRLLETYSTRLLEENRRANLTGERDREAIYRRHFAESFAILAALETGGFLASPAIDIGSGAGFPGLPITIARREIELTLVESNGKKARFLEAIAEELGLTRVRVIQGRAEDLARDAELREQFPVAFARAVAPLRELLELTLPFLTVGGTLAAPKGSGAAREAREAATALSVLGGEVVSAEPLQLPQGGAPLKLIIVRKMASTPERYPRRPGIPHKRPL
jgi:16S rRNA (guanine527-N7)-methyltransferase